MALSISNRTLNQDYFFWLCRKVSDMDHSALEYSMLMEHLHDRRFEWSIPRDANRSADGVDLRYDYAYEEHVDPREVAHYIDSDDCSILEMMVGLANRMELDIMSDCDMGDRTHVWFWEMISSLGLEFYTNDNFDVMDVDNILDRFLDHEYEPNGEGGLFTVPGDRDLRQAEIWYQMNWYLSYIEGEERG